MNASSSHVDSELSTVLYKYQYLSVYDSEHYSLL